jgi:hypothetical protein
MGADHDGTGAQSAYGSGERMSEADMKKGGPLTGSVGPKEWRLQQA